MLLNLDRLGLDVARWTFAMYFAVGMITYLFGSPDPTVLTAG